MSAGALRGKTVARLLSWLREREDEMAALLSDLVAVPTASTDQEEATGQALAQAIQEITGQPANFELCPGLLETRFYAAQGIASCAYGPGLLSVAHGPNEYVDVRRVTECAAIYALTAAKIFERNES